MTDLIVGTDIRFWPGEDALGEHGDQPEHGKVSYVHSDSSVNIGYLDMMGSPHARQKVFFLRDKDSKTPPPDSYCEFDEGKAERYVAKKDGAEYQSSGESPQPTEPTPSTDQSPPSRGPGPALGPSASPGPQPVERNALDSLTKNLSQGNYAQTPQQKAQSTALGMSIGTGTAAAGVNQT